MNPRQTRKHPRATKEDCEKNAKQCEIYCDMPVTENAKCSSSISQELIAGEIFVPTNVLQKGKEVVCPSAVFEKGSTSINSNKPHAINFKKVLIGNSEQTRKHPRKMKEACEKNAKRCEIYRDMPLAEKNALLLQRRLKNRAATTKCLLANTNSTIPVEAACVTQDNLHTECSSSISQVELSGCEIFVPTNVLQKGKEIVCPSAIFEKGSTSTNSNEPYAVNFKKLPVTDSRVILTTKNNFVDEINNMLIDKFPGKAKTFVGIDETIESDNQIQFEDLLHTLNPPGLPPYILSLKENCPIMLLRNLNPYEGLCNGTRLTCCEFKTHVISAKITAGDFKNMHVFIPRIPLLSSHDEKLPVPFKRTQFPVRLCFAMTINKAQGQTLDFVGIYLREPVFSHGQLYVALSRAKISNCVKLLIRPPTPTSDDDRSTCNIVYDEIIQKAGC